MTPRLRVSDWARRGAAELAASPGFAAVTQHTDRLLSDSGSAIRTLGDSFQAYQELLGAHAVDSNAVACQLIVRLPESRNLQPAPSALDMSQVYQSWEAPPELWLTQRWFFGVRRDIEEYSIPVDIPGVTSSSVQALYSCSRGTADGDDGQEEYSRLLIITDYPGLLQTGGEVH